MMNIFANETLYGNAYEQVGNSRPLNEAEMSHLNMGHPALVIRGQFGLSCRMYSVGSNSTYYCKSLDTRSACSEGDIFDLKKCLITVWKKPGTVEEKVKILVPEEAIIAL